MVTHSSQMKTCGPATSARTCSWFLPQKEQRSSFLSFDSSVNCASNLGSGAGYGAKKDSSWPPCGAGKAKTWMAPDVRPAIDVAPKAGFHLRMRTDMLIAGILGTLSVFLALLGFFVLEWSPLVVALLAAVFVIADGYFLFGIAKLAKENQANKTP